MSKLKILIECSDCVKIPLEYCTPKLEIIQLEREDIVTASNGIDWEKEWGDDGNGDW